MFLTNIIQLTALGYDYAKLFDKFMELKMIQIKKLFLKKRENKKNTLNFEI